MTIDIKVALLHYRAKPDGGTSSGTTSSVAATLLKTNTLSLPAECLYQFNTLQHLAVTYCI